MFLLLFTALLYPGDKIIFQKDKVRPIRQPGGYYSDFVFSPTPAQLRSLGFKGPEDKKTDKLSIRSLTPFPLPPVLLLSFSYRSWDADILGISYCTSVSALTLHVQLSHRAWPVPSVTPGMWLRSTATLPHSHTATLLTTSYVISSSLEKIKKRAFLENWEAP